MKERPLKVENIRSSFTIYIADKERKRLEILGSDLEANEYNASVFDDFERLLEFIPQEPPHILFFNYYFICEEPSRIQQILDVSPETQIFILTSPENFKNSMELYSQGIYDCLVSEAYRDPFQKEFSLEMKNQLLRAADRVAELNYYTYMNEQLRESAEEKGESFSGNFTLFNIWMNGLKKCETKKDLIKCFLVEFSRYYKGAPVVFYKYVRSYKSLVSSMHLGVKSFKSGEIIKLTAKEDGQLNNDKLDSIYLESLENIAFDDEEGVYFLPLSILGELKGLFVFSRQEAISNPYVMSCLYCLHAAYTSLELEKRIQSISIYDLKTNVLNRQNFLSRVNNEIIRSRRIQLPSSLLIVSIDNFPGLVEVMPPKDLDLLLKMIATIITKTGRVNDVIGRISSDEFGILLPHTPIEGAAIKAERLRLLIAEAQFSKVIVEAPKATVSFGVSEYPSCSHDMNEILSSADSALASDRGVGGNQVCVATAPPNFKPDFFTQSIS